MTTNAPEIRELTLDEIDIVSGGQQASLGTVLGTFAGCVGIGVHYIASGFSKALDLTSGPSTPNPHQL